MALPIPSVPLVPGVPPLPQLAGALPVPAPPFLFTDAVGLVLPPASAVQWGLFHQGTVTPVVSADSVVTFDYKQDWLVSDYPIEQGSFQSYNRVLVPFDGRVRYSAGGSDADRTSMLASIDAAANSLEIFDIYTPERVFSSVSITHYDFRRTSRNGVGLLVVDVWCQQVRLLATTTFSNTVAPSGATQQDNGVVPLQSPPAALQGLITNTVPSTQSGVTGQWSSVVSGGATAGATGQGLW